MCLGLENEAIPMPIALESVAGLRIQNIVCCYHFPARKKLSIEPVCQNNTQPFKLIFCREMYVLKHACAKSPTTKLGDRADNSIGIALCERSKEH